MGYTTVTKKLTPAILAQAEDQVRENRHKAGTEWREPRTGFAVRFNLDGAIYLLRAEGGNPKIGAVGELPFHIARHLAGELKLAMRARRDHKAYLRIYLERHRAGDDHDTAHIEALRASNVQGEIAPEALWTVAELSKDFVVYKLEHDLKEGRSSKNFAKLFEDKVFDPIRNKKVREVTHRDFFAIRKAVVPSGGKGDGRAVTIVRYMKQMFDHGLQRRPDVCGLFDRDPIWRAVEVERHVNPRDRAPEPAELARTLLAVEMHAERKDGVVVASKVLQVLLAFVFFTAQRDGAASRLLRKNFFAFDERPGWWVAHFDASQVKGGKGKTRAHAVPVPPVLVAAIEAMWAEADPDGRSEFVFPGHRGAGPRAATGLNQLFRQLRGDAGDRRPTPKDDYRGKPGPKPRPARLGKPANLLEVYLRELKSHPDQPTDFTPHDARRGLTNFLSEKDMGAVASAILGHAGASSHKKFVEETEEQQMAHTTSRWYCTAQRLDYKAQGIELWADALTRALAEERARVEEIGRAIA